MKIFDDDIDENLISNCGLVDNLILRTMCKLLCLFVEFYLFIVLMHQASRSLSFVQGPSVSSVHAFVLTHNTGFVEY